MTGEVAILNVGEGDTKLTFDPTNPAEVERSARIVKDMLRRGFVLLIEVGHNEKGPIYQRAHDFDEATAEYIIAGIAEPQEDHEEAEDEAAPSRPRKSAPPRPRKAERRRVPAASANAVSVSRTAGG